MLVDEVARPQEISRAFRNSPEIHGRAPLLSVLRAAYASDEGVATFTRGTRGGASGYLEKDCYAEWFLPLVTITNVSISRAS